jgi:REP element-mobilizing transposase RayT
VPKGRALRLDGFAPLPSMVPDFGWRCFAYCAMPNHFHVVLQITRESLASGMRWLSGIHARTFNNRHNRTGHVFGGRYRPSIVASEQHLAHACRYVECNPVLAGLCAHPSDWPWSSYRAAVRLDACAGLLVAGCCQARRRPKGIRRIRGRVGRRHPKRVRPEGSDPCPSAKNQGSDPVGLTRSQGYSGSAAYRSITVPSGSFSCA